MSQPLSTSPTLAEDRSALVMLMLVMMMLMGQ
jgi:hypothetical protein